MSHGEKGKWNLEHRIPMDAFDLSNIVERMAASHYSNIQPMWQPDNLQKHNKYYVTECRAFSA